MNDLGVGGFVATVMPLVIMVVSLGSLGFCRKLAIEKGYSPGIWSVLGFFFSVLALLTLVGLPIRTKQNREVIAPGSEKNKK